MRNATGFTGSSARGLNELERLAFGGGLSAGLLPSASYAATERTINVHLDGRRIAQTSAKHMPSVLNVMGVA